jgi:hypothetical protein
MAKGSQGWTRAIRSRPRDGLGENVAAVVANTDPRMSKVSYCEQTQTKGSLGAVRRRVNSLRGIWA